MPQVPRDTGSRQGSRGPVEAGRTMPRTGEPARGARSAGCAEHGARARLGGDCTARRYGMVASASRAARKRRSLANLGDQGRSTGTVEYDSPARRGGDCRDDVEVSAGSSPVCLSSAGRLRVQRRTAGIPVAGYRLRRGSHDGRGNGATHVGDGWRVSPSLDGASGAGCRAVDDGCGVAFRPNPRGTSHLVCDEGYSSRGVSVMSPARVAVG